MKKVLLLCTSLLSSLLFVQPTYAQDNGKTIDLATLRKASVKASNWYTEAMALGTATSGASTPNPTQPGNPGTPGGGGSISGISADIASRVSLTVGPNPMEDYVTIHGEGLPDDDYQVLVADLSGKVVSNQKIRTVTHELDCRVIVTSLPCGLYVFTVVANSYQQVFKMVK